MRFLVALLAAISLSGAEDAREIVRRAAERDRSTYPLASAYTFVERQETHELDGDGHFKKSQIKTFDVTLSDGSPYRRLIARDDKPLSADEERQEREKLERSIVERRNETPEQRAKRLADWEKRRRRQREFVEDLPQAFNFSLVGEEKVSGRDLWVIEGVPRPGYQPRSFTTRFLTRMKGKLWIDKADYAVVKIDAEVIDTVTYGGFIIRVHKGTRFHLEQTRVNDEVWLPKHVHLIGSARIALVKKVAGEIDLTYRDYRKFTADSRVLSFEDGSSTQSSPAAAGPK